jgi:hypothetical protein
MRSYHQRRSPKSFCIPVSFSTSSTNSPQSTLPTGSACSNAPPTPQRCYEDENHTHIQNPPHSPPSPCPTHLSLCACKTCLQLLLCTSHTINTPRTSPARHPRLRSHDTSALMGTRGAGGGSVSCAMQSPMSMSHTCKATKHATSAVST